MALIRSHLSSAAVADGTLDPALLAGRLRHGTLAERRDAARQLALLPGSSPMLVEQLEEEHEPLVREALMLALARQGDDCAVRALLDCLRSEDAALRSDAIELLKTAGNQHPELIREALSDLDADVRILALGILESLRHPDVEQWLIEVIEHDTHANVCACAIDLLYEVGTPRAIPALEECRERFAHEDYLIFAVELALGRLQGADGP